jgi:hypothetical protein
LKPSRLLWLLTLIFCLGLALDWLPWLRGDISLLPPDARWVWPYALPRWIWLLPCVLGIAVYVAGALHLLNTNADRRHVLLWAFVGSVLLPLLLLTLEGRPLFLLFTRSASVVTGAYQPASVMITNLGDTLRDWLGFVQRFRTETAIYGGVALDPPGLAALYYGTTQALAASPGITTTFAALVRPLECQNLGMMAWTDAQMASAWMQMTVPLWAALTVAPIYRLGKAIFGRETARTAVLLWPLVPGIAMFTPRFNAFYPLIMAVLLVVLWRGLDRSRWPWLVLAGFVVSGATFLNLSLVPLGLLGGLTIIGHGLRCKSGWRVSIRNLLLFGVGSGSIWLLYYALAGVKVTDVVALGLGAHLHLNRPYLPWLLIHPYDMYLFTGLPVALLAVWAMVRQRAGRAGIFTLAAALTLAILTLSGTARGETGRVWLFFAPIWILLAAAAMQRLPRRIDQRAVFVMQSLCLLSMAAVLRVHFTALTVPPTMPIPDEAAAMLVESTFTRSSDSVTLVGFTAETTDSAILLHLHWRAESYVRRPYALSLVPVPPDQSYKQGITWNPANWTYPPSCWMPGQEFVDTVSVPLGANSPPGDWWFSLSISDVYTHEPMNVAGQTQLGFGPVHVAH